MIVRKKNDVLRTYSVESLLIAGQPNVICYALDVICYAFTFRCLTAKRCGRGARDEVGVN